MLRLVDELEGNVRTRFDEHNQKFDAGSEIVVSKSLCDFNVALLDEYFLPKIEAI